MAGNCLGVSAATYPSELTGLPVDAALQNQRPVAIMVDNEKAALKHYGISQADIQYEMVNSTANNRITRSMYIVKDWNAIQKFGNIRSTRPTNLLVAPEFNAVVIHDGGPYYCDAYYPTVDHISGGFSRINNGKKPEYTEYVTTGQISQKMTASGISPAYKAGFNKPKFTFGNAVLSAGSAASSVSLPFPKTSSALKYNASKGSYDHYLYGAAHVDAGNNTTVSYKNVILQCVDMAQLDKNGYMIYNVIGGGKGYYITDGKAMPINWVKTSATDRTLYYYDDCSELVVNPGKTYVGLVPSDSWAKVAIK